MNIGIIGSGMIGGTFGKLTAAAGHNVLFSSRNPDKLKSLAAEAGQTAATGTVKNAVQFGEIILLSVPYKAIPEIADIIAEHTADKVIIDTCNPYPARDGEIAETIRADKTRRHSQFIADSFPNAHIVKAINTIYYQHLEQHALKPPGKRTALPIAGDQIQAKQKVMKLLNEIGFDTVDIGTIADSKPMEVDQVLYNKPMSASEIENIIKTR